MGIIDGVKEWWRGPGGRTAPEAVRRTGGPQARPWEDPIDASYWADLARPRTERQERWAIAWARTFAFVLDLYPPPGSVPGGYWSAEGIEEATGGFVKAAYFRALVEGRIYAPLDEALAAVAGAVGVEQHLLYRGVGWWEGVHADWGRGANLVRAIAAAEEEHAELRLSRFANRLFERLGGKDDRPGTDAELSASSRSRLTEEEVRAIRDGRLTSIPELKLLPFCEAFGVDPSYWRGSEGPHKVARFLVEVMNGEPYLVSPCSRGRDGRTMIDVLVEYIEHEEKIAVTRGAGTLI